MKLDIFKKSISRADDILKPFNISVSKLLENCDESTFDDILNSFIAVACIQVSMEKIDIL